MRISIFHDTKREGKNLFLLYWPPLIFKKKFSNFYFFSEAIFSFFFHKNGWNALVSSREKTRFRCGMLFFTAMSHFHQHLDRSLVRPRTYASTIERPTFEHTCPEGNIILLSRGGVIRVGVGREEKKHNISFPSNRHSPKSPRCCIKEVEIPPRERNWMIFKPIPTSF